MMDSELSWLPTIWSPDVDYEEVRAFLQSSLINHGWQPKYLQPSGPSTTITLASLYRVK